MADNTTNDVYDDPDNILSNTDDTVEGGTELPANEQGDLSQSVYLPEREGDDRGKMDDIDPDLNDEHNESTGDTTEDPDPDADHLGDVNPADEQDGTER